MCCVCSVCLQVVGRVRGAAAAPVTTAAALLAAAEAAGGGSAGDAHALTDSSSEAAAAALLASPRHGLHTPRASRVSEQQVELAVVGPGDIIGEADWGPLCLSVESVGHLRLIGAPTVYL
jgi:hypothetical protein